MLYLYTCIEQYLKRSNYLCLSMEPVNVSNSKWFGMLLHFKLPHNEYGLVGMLHCGSIGFDFVESI